LQRRDLVCLGLDGSIRDDATALVACDLAGHIELMGLWEKPEGPEGEGVVRSTGSRSTPRCRRRCAASTSCGFYADPAHWQDYLDKWHKEFAEDMQVKATADRSRWSGGRTGPTAMVAALERFHEAVLDERVSFTPPEDRAGREQELALAFTRHVLNARRAISRAGLQIRKEHPKSAKKIDACMSAVLAYECRNDAVAAGVTSRADELQVPRRIR
jgi:hypothetical protein